MMLASAQFLLLAATGTWVGAILFQSAIVAPSVFGVLDAAAARHFLRTLFPRFFRMGLVCSGLSLVAAVAAGIVADWQSRDTANVLLAASMAAMAGIALGMIPAINAARDAGDLGRARFATLHRVSVILTVCMLLIGLAIIAVTVMNPGA